MSRSTLYSLVAGAAASGAAAAIVVMVGLAAGLWSRPHLLLAPLGLAAVGVAAVLSRCSLREAPFRIGATTAGVAALPVEALSSQPGMGVVQLAAIGSALALALVGTVALRPLTLPLPGSLAVVGIVAVAFVLVRVVLGGGELGHDEAAYALKARTWLAGTPDTGWSLHRGLGQSVLALAVLPFTESAIALRLVAVVLSLATVAAVWALGRTMASHRAGLVAAAVFAVAPSFLRRGAEFLTDLPSTGLLLAVAVLLWRWSVQGAGDAALYWAVAAGAAAFYIRYQSILSLGLLAVAALVVAGNRRRSRAPAVAAGLGLVLLIPHFAYAASVAGSPWGILVGTAGAGGREYLGEGLVDYLGDFPDLLAGQIGALALIVSLVWLTVQIAGREGRRKAALFLGIPMVGQFLVLGLISHGEPRFVFFPVALGMVAAGAAVDDLESRWRPRWLQAGAWALAAALASSLALHGDRADRNAESRAESVRALEQAAAVVEHRTDGRCGILTGYQPQLTWLSGCPTQPYHETEVRVPFDPATPVFLVLAEEGIRQPEGDLLDGYLERTAGEPVVVSGEGSLGDVALWELSRP